MPASSRDAPAAGRRSSDGRRYQRPGHTPLAKTTLLNSLTGAIPGRERVITCEEVFELRLGLPDVVGMQTRQPNLEGFGEIRLRRLVKEALRMRPGPVEG